MSPQEEIANNEARYAAIQARLKNPAIPSGLVLNEDEATINRRVAWMERQARIRALAVEAGLSVLTLGDVIARTLTAGLFGDEVR